MNNGAVIIKIGTVLNQNKKILIEKFLHHILEDKKIEINEVYENRNQASFISILCKKMEQMEYNDFFCSERS